MYGATTTTEASFGLSHLVLNSDAVANKIMPFPKLAYSEITSVVYFEKFIAELTILWRIYSIHLRICPHT